MNSLEYAVGEYVVKLYIIILTYFQFISIEINYLGLFGVQIKQPLIILQERKLDISPPISCFPLLYEPF